jgi:hypothetical protein
MFYLHVNHSIGVIDTEIILLLIVSDLKFPGGSHSFDPNILMEREGLKKLVF